MPEVKIRIDDLEIPVPEDVAWALAAFKLLVIQGDKATLNLNRKWSERHIIIFMKKIEPFIRKKGSLAKLTMN